MSKPSTATSPETDRQRPLSPHLQIYRPQMTSVLSILHRITGVGLMVGLGLVTWFLVAAASGPEAYAQVQNFCASLIGMLMLLGWTFALFYHLCNGIRHLIWDTGHLFNMDDATRAGYIVLLSASFLTALLWVSVAFF